MKDDNSFEVIITGGSYAGLSAGMALGRSLRKTLIIDSGKPCNIQTPHSHNFITQDGKAPGEIFSAARAQVEKYNSIRFYSGTAISGTKTEKGFEIKTQSGDSFTAKKIIFATGVKDIMPAIKGFAECWGISVIHCPYCHGYEVRNEKTGILGNDYIIFEFTKLINHWAKDLTLFTNGNSKLTDEQAKQLQNHKIQIIETEIDRIEQTDGQIENVVFSDGNKIPMKVLYAKIPFEQHCDIPLQLGCELNEQGLIKIDAFQKTTVPGVFACGDNSFMMRSVANAVAMGTLAGAMVNKEIIDEEF